MILDHSHFTLLSSNNIPKSRTINSSNMLSTHNPSTTASYDRSEPKITALPSFSELLTSIPLPTAFKPRSNSNVSTTSVNTSDSSSCIGLSSMPAPSSTQPHQQQNQHQHQHQHHQHQHQHQQQMGVFQSRLSQLP